ncbi:hypothetical protein, partial [Sinosporangium album]|uniref:hypothetical protein n=1 Tax=Sinosporangium album TaxID=504805 RepID=UPI001C409F32
TGLPPASDDELTNNKISRYATASPPALLGARDHLIERRQVLQHAGRQYRLLGLSHEVINRVAAAPRQPPPTAAAGIRDVCSRKKRALGKNPKARFLSTKSGAGCGITDSSSSWFSPVIMGAGEAAASQAVSTQLPSGRTLF